MHDKLSGLYVITDNSLTPNEKVLQMSKEALKGGAKIIQLRDKKNSQEIREELALKLQNLCREFNSLFVLNDDVELALKLKCDGLHIGESEYHRVAKIREEFKGVLGVSCYGDIKTALKMQDLKVDYVAFGSFFNSPTKPKSSIVPLETINEANEKLSIPTCVIGGINITNLNLFKNSKPNMVAVISDIWESKNITEKCKEYEKFFKD